MDVLGSWGLSHILCVIHVCTVSAAGPCCRSTDEDEVSKPPGGGAAAAGGEAEDVKGPHTNLAVRLSQRDPHKKWLLGERLSYVLLTGAYMHTGCIGLEVLCWLSVRPAWGGAVCGAGRGLWHCLGGWQQGQQTATRCQRMRVAKWVNTERARAAVLCCCCCVAACRQQEPG